MRTSPPEKHCLTHRMRKQVKQDCKPFEAPIARYGPPGRVWVPAESMELQYLCLDSPFLHVFANPCRNESKREIEGTMTDLTFITAVNKHPLPQWDVLNLTQVRW